MSFACLLFSVKQPKRRVFIPKSYRALEIGLRYNTLIYLFIFTSEQL